MLIFRNVDVISVPAEKIFSKARNTVYGKIKLPGWQIIIKVTLSKWIAWKLLEIISSTFVEVNDKNMQVESLKIIFN